MTKYNGKKHRKHKAKQKVKYSYREEKRNHSHHGETAAQVGLKSSKSEHVENRTEYASEYEVSPRHSDVDIHPRIKNLTWRVIKEPHDWYKHTIKLLKQTTLNKNLFELYCWAARTSEKNSKLSPRYHSRGRKKTKSDFDHQHILSIEGHHFHGEQSMGKEHGKEENNLLETKLKKVTRGKWKTPGEIAILVGRERNKQKTSPSDIPLTLQCFASEMQKVWRTTATTSYLPYHNSKSSSLPRTTKQPNSNPKVYHPNTGEIVRLSQILHQKSRSRNKDVEEESNIPPVSTKVSTDLKNTFGSMEDLEHYLAVNQYINEYVDSSRSVEKKQQKSDEVLKIKFKKPSKRIPPGQNRFQDRFQNVSRYSRNNENLSQIIPIVSTPNTTRAISKMRYETVLNNQLKVTSVSITPVPPCPPPCSPCKSYSSFVQRLSTTERDRYYHHEAQQTDGTREDKYLVLPPIDRINSPPPAVDTNSVSPEADEGEFIIFHSEDFAPPVTPRSPTRLTLHLPGESVSCSGEDDTQTESDISPKHYTTDIFLPPLPINATAKYSPTDSGIITPLNTPHSSCTSIAVETTRNKSSANLPDIKVHLPV